MLAIFRREFKAYFSSAIGYVFLGVFLFFAGFLFVLSNIFAGSSDMSSLFSSLTFIYIIIIPILTMKIFSEERKQKTDQALLTAPVSITGIVMGKFLSALSVFAIGLSSTALFALIMATVAHVEGFVVLGNIVGMLLIGSALISIGIFISSLTENQVIAAVGSLAIILLLYLIGGITSFFQVDFVQKIVDFVSFLNRYNNFSMGIFNISDAVYYLSIAAVFLFLTTRVLEKRRWS